MPVTSDDMPFAFADDVVLSLPPLRHRISRDIEWRSNIAETLLQTLCGKAVERRWIHAVGMSGNPRIGDASKKPYVREARRPCCIS
jgi:hypothetical protein